MHRATTSRCRALRRGRRSRNRHVGRKGIRQAYVGIGRAGRVFQCDGGDAGASGRNRGRTECLGGGDLLDIQSGRSQCGVSYSLVILDGTGSGLY